MNLNLNWICGSGGTKKIFNSKTETCIGVVSRASKLPLQLESIADFEHCIGQELQFIGVNNVGSLGRRKCHGYVSKLDIFKNLNGLFLPDGYGEGFPHVACDALTSGMHCWLSMRNFVQYGCSQMEIRVVDRKGQYLCIESMGVGSNSQFSDHQIVAQYRKIIEELIDSNCVSLTE